MHIKVHPAQTLLRGDERYNPRFTKQADIRFDGATRLTGEMRPDSPVGVAVTPRLPNIPFRLIVPADADYRAINLEVWRRLETGSTLWDLDFTPPPPPPANVRSISGAALVLSALGVVAVGAIVATAARY